MSIKDSILSEENRQKLDVIVQDMVTNKESEEDIQLVVDDFKNKYNIKKKEDTDSTPEVQASASNGSEKIIGTIKAPDKITSQDMNPKMGDESILKENWKALKSSGLRTIGAIARIPDLVRSSVFEYIEKPIMRATGSTDEDINVSRIASKITPIGGVLPPTITGIQTQERLNEAASKIESTMKQYNGGVIDNIKSGNYGDAARLVAKGFTQSLPYLAMIAASGGSAPVMLTTMGTTAAAQRLGDIDEQKLMEGKEGKQILNSWLYGGFEAVPELFTMGIFSSFKRALAGASKEAIEKEAKDIAFNFLKEFGGESATEGVTELGEQVSDYIQGNRDNIDLKQVGDAAIIGGFAIAPLSGTTVVANSVKGSRIASKEDIQKVQENTEKVVDLKDQKKEASETVQDVINEEIKKTTEENDKIIQGNIDKAQNLKLEDVNQIEDINRAIDDYSQKIFDKKNRQEDFSIEEQLIKSLKNKRDELIKIKSKENAIQERSTETIPVVETPGHREEVGTRIPQPEELTVPQEEKTPQETLQEINPEIIGEVQEPRLSGIKKALVPESKVEETDIEKRTVNEMLERGKYLIDNRNISPTGLIKSIIEKPRALQSDEVASFVYYKTQLDNNFDAIQDKIEAAENSGDVESVAQLRTTRDAVLKEIDDYHEMSLLTAYEQGLAFRLRQMLLDSEYNLQSQVRKYKAVNQGKIPIEVEERFREYDRQLKGLNKELRDARRKIGDKEANDIINGIKEAEKKTSRKRGKDLMAEGFQELIQSFGGMSMVAGEKRPTVSKSLIKIGRGLIDEGLATVENVLEKINQFVFDKTEGKTKLNIDDYKDEVMSGILEYRGKPQRAGNKLVMPKDIIRDYVIGGMDDINEIVKAIKKDFNLEENEREIRDAITDYGKTSVLSKDEIDVKIRELRRIGRTISGMEDVIEEKKKPLRSGFQRDKLTDRERKLQRELREVMKELPQTEEETADSWKSALDAVKTRLRNQITDLERQITTGEKTPKKKGIEYDAEAKTLQEQRDALREIIQGIEGKPELSDEQKVRNAIRSAERWSDEYERRIREKDFSPLRQKSNIPVTEELTVARKRMGELRNALNQLRDIEGVTEKLRLDRLKNNLKKRITEYERRLKEKDYTLRKKIERPILDKEAANLEIEKNRIKDKFDIEMEKVRLKNRPLSQKIGDSLIDIINLPKSLLASADLSAPLRQGAILSAAHPKIASKTFIEMFRQAFSQKRADEWLERVKADPEFNIIRQSKLYLAEPTTKLSAKEEQFMTNIAHKIPIWGHVVKGSERAYVGYLNKLRVDVFTQGADYLMKNGYNFDKNPEIFRAYAEFINNASGRGNLGALENSAPVLNTFFFSPRLVASRINLLNPVKYVRMPAPIRRMALKDMATFIGVGTMVLAIAKAGGASVELDPRSTDFGKIRIGNLRFDIWAGFQQIVRTMAQVISGEKKSTVTGKITKISAKKYPFETRADVVGRFIRYKMAPLPSLGYDILSGETSMGEKVTPIESIKKEVIPLYLQDMVDIYKEEGAIGVSGAIIPGLFGVGTQYYKPKPKPEKKAPYYR